MKKKLLLSTALCGLMMFGMAQETKAATTASQTVTGTLGLIRIVVANGGTIASNIDENGNLVTAFSPAFRILTNRSSSQAMVLSATLTDQSGSGVNALYGNGTTNNLILANTAAGEIPTAAAIADIKAGSADPDNNPNAIAYTVTNPVDVPGDLAYTWNNGNQNWDADLTNRGITDTELVVPSGAAVANTFNVQDAEGDYEAIVTLSFV